MSAVARVALSLAELVVAARLADAPLPFAPEGPGTGRLSARLAGTRPHLAHEVVAAELARAEDAGPDGAAAALAARGLHSAAGLEGRLASVLHALGEAPLQAVLDATVLDDTGERRVRAWWAVDRGALSGLVLHHPTGLELVAAPVAAWPAELARLVPAPSSGRAGSSDRVVLPTEALLGALAAQRRGRPDLVAPIAAAHGVPGLVPLLHALGSGCRGRLRLLVVRRRPPAPPAVTVWVLLDDGWRSLRPVTGARVEVRARRPVDLGLASHPWVGRAA